MATSGLARRDLAPPVPSIAGTAVVGGAVLGGLATVAGGVMAWLALMGVPGGNPVVAIALYALAWGVAIGLAFGLLLAATLAVSGWLLGRERRLWSASQAMDITTPWSRARAMSAAVEAIAAATGTEPRRVDLQAGMIYADVRQHGLFASRRVRLIAAFPAQDGEPTRVVFSVAPASNRGRGIDLGANRTLLDAMVERFERLHADAGFARDALGLDALPPGALERLALGGDTVGAVRAIGDGDAVLSARVYSVLALPREVLVAPVAEDLAPSHAQEAARQAGAREARHARGGAGFALLPVGAGEDPARLGRALHQTLLARREGYRGHLRATSAAPAAPAAPPQVEGEAVRGRSGSNGPRAKARG